MSRLVPGQRLWPVVPGAGYGPPIAVVEVDDRDATICDHAGRLLTINAENGVGCHVTDWTDRDGWRHFHTDARRATLSARESHHRAMMRIGMALGHADFPTLNRVLTTLRLPEVVAWVPTENA